MPDFGDVEPNLTRVLRYANYLWGRDLTLADLAVAIDCDRRTVEHLGRDDLQRYNLPAIARIRWFYGCRLSDLLRRVPPGEKSSRPGPAEHPTIERVGPPSGLPPACLTLASRLPDLLRGYSEKELAAGLGLHRKSVETLRARQVARLSRRTLAALCTFLSEREGCEVGVEDLLVEANSAP